MAELRIVPVKTQGICKYLEHTIHPSESRDDGSGVLPALKAMW
jgi:hypothetical protein